MASTENSQMASCFWRCAQLNQRGNERHLSQVTQQKPQSWAVDLSLDIAESLGIAEIWPTAVACVIPSEYHFV